MKLHRGELNRILDFYIQDLGGAGKTGLVASTTNLSAAYKVEGQPGWNIIPLVAGTPGTYLAGGFSEASDSVRKGYYELGLPNAVLSSGRKVIVVIVGDGILDAQKEIELDAIDYQNSQNAGLRHVEISAGYAAFPYEIDPNTLVLTQFSEDETRVLFQTQLHRVSGKITNRTIPATPGSYPPAP